MIVAHAQYPGGSLALRSQDKIWFGRSLAAETDRSEAGRAAAGWVELSRTIWLLLHGHTTTAGLPCSRAPSGRGISELEPVLGPMTFTAGIRCFSAPVNSYIVQRDPERMARRMFFLTASWAQLERRSPGIRSFVDRFFAGKVENRYPTAADFDAPNEVPPGAHVLATVGGNSLMTEPGTEHWTANTITIVPASALPSGGAAVAGGILAAIAALLTGGWYWLHTREQARLAKRNARRRRRH